jgi:excisionase family DNA binding protein
MAGKHASSSIPVSERLLSFAEAATRLNLSLSTLRQKLHAGCGPIAIRLPGSTHWRFRPRDLDAAPPRSRQKQWPPRPTPPKGLQTKTPPGPWWETEAAAEALSGAKESSS